MPAQPDMIAVDQVTGEAVAMVEFKWDRGWRGVGWRGALPEGPPKGSSDPPAGV